MAFPLARDDAPGAVDFTSLVKSRATNATVWHERGSGGRANSQGYPVRPWIPAFVVRAARR